MSLRIKLAFFTAIFVMLASIAILSLSIYQTSERRKHDIAIVLSLGAKHQVPDEYLHTRIEEIKSDTDGIIRDRVLYSGFLLAGCALFIFFFSRRITDPINHLVSIAEAIASGRKNYSERIELPSHDEIGRLSRSFNTLLAYTERLLLEAKVHAENYRELIENANSAIIRITIEGRVLFFNECAQKIFGYTSDEALEKPIDHTIGRSMEREGRTPHFIELLKENTYIEVEHRSRNGCYLWIGWTIKPIVDKQNILKAFLCVGSDITERKKAEKYAAIEQQKLIHTDKMATLGVLAAGVAHEINNPNNFIIFNSQILPDVWRDALPVLDKHALAAPEYTVAGIPYPEIRRELPSLVLGITDGARRIKSIVDSLKNFVRQDSGDLGEIVDLRNVVEAAQTIAGNAIKRATANYSYVKNGDIPCVRGNFQRLEQVVINLITNACQATDDPGKPITVSVDHDPAAGMVAVSVADRGGGIPAENMKSIFDPFFTTKRENGGTGLGLAIAYAIIKEHKGDLKIDSTPGEGTTATFFLPAA